MGIHGKLWLNEFAVHAYFCEKGHDACVTLAPAKGDKLCQLEMELELMGEK